MNIPKKYVGQNEKLQHMLNILISKMWEPNENLPI